MIGRDREQREEATGVVNDDDADDDLRNGNCEQIATIFVHNHRCVLLFPKRSASIFVRFWSQGIRFPGGVVCCLNGNVDVGIFFNCVRIVRSCRTTREVKEREEVGGGQRGSGSTK